MKYLLKFKIKTRSERYDLILKVEYDEESVKKNGFCEHTIVNCYARQIFHLKWGEVIEGPEEIRYSATLVFKLRRYRYRDPDRVAITLDVCDDSVSVNFLGSEPILE